MALRKYDTVNSEQFITPIHGLYSEHTISVEDFKDGNAGLIKNHWIDTSYCDKGEKIYELFDPYTEGEIVKESIQEWLCDNRHKVTQCIGIALCNHELSYAEWFKFVDNSSGPDELALYSLSRKYGIHTSVYNKSYVWTTLMNHVSRSDEEIFGLSGVHLVYLGLTKYGIIRDIRVRQTDSIPNPPKPSRNSSKRAGKVTCRSSSRGRKSTNRGLDNAGRKGGGRGKIPQTLSKSRRANYGISVTNITTQKVCSSRKQIDYVSLNDGFEDEEPLVTKKQQKESYRPRGAPSATRLSAHKKISSPESIPQHGESTGDKFSAVPSTSARVPLTDISPAEDTLPDLAVNQPQDKKTGPELNNPAVLDPGEQPPTATNTLEDLEAASTFLSLGDTFEDTLEKEDDNALLMPIGGANNPEDLAPQPLCLDQASVDNVIAGLVEMEELEKDVID